MAKKEEEKKGTEVEHEEETEVGNRRKPKEKEVEDEEDKEEVEDEEHKEEVEDEEDKEEAEDEEYKEEVEDEEKERKGGHYRPLGGRDFCPEFVSDKSHQESSNDGVRLGSSLASSHSSLGYISSNHNIFAYDLQFTLMMYSLVVEECGTVRYVYMRRVLNRSESFRVVLNRSKSYS